MTISVNDLKPGQSGTILKLKGISDEFRRRIVEMGVTPGAKIELERVAPMGDPMEFKIMGYHLSLRRKEVGEILVDLV
ncbi:MAG: ferrous iron transport protein A [Calditrichaeota bacterium]|jgi:Fe2+ transport system protein FeoA|nr:ferrous iron transport protein A [Calditrichota bacterium]MBT7619372.1 ferrous iron transport protein A [Calditrichota bacterium]MBT7790347.1 ferrous iron transport protein A [Calditrichota bacterium]